MIAWHFGPIFVEFILHKVRVGPWQLPGGRNSGRKWQLPFSATSIQVANWPAEKRKWQK
jgi:hypothetical protein